VDEFYQRRQKARTTLDISPIFIAGLAILLFQVCFWTVRIRDTFRSLLMAPVIEPDDKAPQEGRDYPLISVIVPAHNEEEGIVECLESCMAQDYPNIEVIMVDDRSSDRTLERAKALQEKDKRLRVIKIDTLPPGWTGKCHALDVGAYEAKGAWLAFLDADSVMERSCLRKCHEMATQNNVGMVTLSPAPILKTFWEKAAQPIFLGMSNILFPLERINDPNDPIASANGMFFLISRHAYDEIDGHRDVKDLAVEDIGIGKRVKAKGLGLIFANGRKVLSTRMYTGVRQTLDGWTRILSASINYSLPHAIKLFIAHTLAGMPVTLAALAMYIPQASQIWPDTWMALPLLLIVQINVVAYFFYLQLGAPAKDSALLPIGSVMLSLVLAKIIKRIAAKEPLMWRGNVYETSRYEPRNLDPSGPSQ
jgi:cellulose synthase/poly-beta-1,6-N-acetylglucosamine synthase-like glycosyltransferase